MRQTNMGFDDVYSKRQQGHVLGLSDREQAELKAKREKEEKELMRIHQVKQTQGSHGWSTSYGFDN